MYRIYLNGKYADDADDFTNAFRWVASGKPEKTFAVYWDISEKEGNPGDTKSLGLVLDGYYNSKGQAVITRSNA